MSNRRIESLRLVWLEAFLAVAETPTYLAAAEKLGCNQSTVTRYIRDLEGWARKALIEQVSPTKLTEDGQAFVSVARQVVDLLMRNRGPEPDVKPRVSASDIDMSFYTEQKEGEPD